MRTGLDGKVVVVSGAASGIGLATTRMFLEEGAHVVGGDLRPDVLRELGSDCVAVECDLATEQGNAALVDGAMGRFGRIDAVVNNVGTFPYREGFLQTSIEDWTRGIEINFLSMVRLTRRALPHLLSGGGGSVVSVASECGRQPDVFFVDYSVTKAAIINLSKSLANEFGPRGVRSNVVSPGPTRTAQWDVPGGFGDSLAKRFDLGKEAAIEHFAKVARKLPTGRVGRPEEVAAAIVFLSSTLAGQVTGAEYTVNGGSYVAA
ncbi:SDR family oxidoreductase [Jatrophihabitans endophyticus]|uniref:SDR family NAD(P)-dependent oxidoreductase n=1 Tax=Jatrophihabitans endophyticus TaxID=1206085 RepID=UPI0019EE01B9|nr:SDR family oxidoreductase [Jatrophihabitans endophyticus]MBE7190722.1 SDR family oxidoreductase [Jatrophihabitans endophyticus]